MSKTPSIRVGTSGYQYDHWVGPLYPPGLPKSRWFERYAEQFDTVEINNTFYGLPKAESFASWRKRAPEGFCYALKFSRYGSHIKRLTMPEQTIGTFLDRAAPLGATLGPILVQLPPRWPADPQRLEDFLAAAPRRFRWAVEFRDPSWLCEEVYAVLRRHKTALCIHDHSEMGQHPRIVTSGWVYLRFHGGSNGSYSGRELAAWAEQAKQYLADGLDVYAYFNNDVKGWAVANALELRRLVWGEK